MKTVQLRPFIPSGEDYSLAQRFFEEIGCEKLFSNDGLSLFRMGEQHFYLQNFHNPDFQSNYMVEIRVESLDGWWQHMQELGLEQRYPIKMNPPKLFPWGSREVHLIDPAGVCWHIAEQAKHTD